MKKTFTILIKWVSLFLSFFVMGFGLRLTHFKAVFGRICTNIARKVESLMASTSSIDRSSD